MNLSRETLPLRLVSGFSSLPTGARPSPIVPRGTFEVTRKADGFAMDLSPPLSSPPKKNGFHAFFWRKPLDR